MLRRSPELPPQWLTDIDWQKAQDLSERHGDSFFVLDLDRLRANVETWREAFRTEYPDTDIAFPYKANNLPAICESMAELGVRAEVCSPMEWWLAGHVGVSPRDVIYNGSGRPAASVVEALVSGATVIVDSPRDARIVAEAARSNRGRRFDVGIRCNLPAPGEPAGRLGLVPQGAQWEEAVATLSDVENLRIEGLHCHLLGGDPAEFRRRISALLEVASDVFRTRSPGFLDIGGGFYEESSEQWTAPGPKPTPADYARAVGEPLRQAFREATPRPTLVIEPGRALVTTAMTLVSRVMDVKPGPRRPVAVVAGSIFHTSPNTRRTDFPVHVLATSRCETPLRHDHFDVAGSSPMPDEWLALRVDGTVAEGDFVVFRNVGAYSVSVRTVFTHPSPAVLGHAARTGFTELAPAGTPEQILGPAGEGT